MFKPTQAKVVLDESQFGRGLIMYYRCKHLPVLWKWSFYNVDRNGDLQHITVGDKEDPILIAVTKEQYKNWSRGKVFAKKRKWYWWLSLKRKIFLKASKNFTYIKSSNGRYLYVNSLENKITLIFSRYGVKIITPSFNQSVWSVIYDHWKTRR